MPFLSEMDQSNGMIGEIPRDKGRELATAYNEAAPFPHIVIDDFLPAPILDKCLAEFPGTSTAEDNFDRAQERLKASFNPDKLAPNLRCLFYSFNSLPFIRILENITTIRGLIPDPYFAGAGFHQISQGGHLSMHADFNHHKPMNLERRINVLIYLNKGWRAEYGGQLELWDNEMTRCVQSVVPEFNKCVIFNTTSHSNHGNPQPVNHPNGTPRRSIALYYYTSTWSEDKREHTTQFHARPGSSDKIDWRVKTAELLRDFTPPIIQRNIRRLKSRELAD
jgi:Rps23 Pro-64 3,4-dihydroxylase Tpa1-like proline 4-hydroxylase